MIVTLTAVMLTAAAAKAGEVDPANPIASVNRLAKLHAASAPGDTEERSAQRARLGALVQYVNRVDARMNSGAFRSEEWYNVLQVVRDMTDAGVGMSVLPEEALCWRRVGLDLAWSHHRFAVARGQSQLIDQSRAQLELMRSQYVTTRERCAGR